MKNVYTADSQVAGTGLFTAQNIKVQQIILRFDGEHLFHDYTPEFAIEGANWIGIGEREWLIPEPGSPVLYLNHCCRPNVFINQNLELISATLIPANSELFLDYSTTELDPFWSMQCNCGTAECRHLIKSFPFLPLTKQLQYRPYINRIFWDETQQITIKNKGRMYG